MASMEKLGLKKNFWRHRKVFVTGGTGLLGSWLVDYLVKSQADVVVLVRDWVPQSNLFKTKGYPEASIVRGAIEDYQLLERIIGEYEIETIFHLAAQTIVPIANANPLSTFESNIKGSWNILEASRRAPSVRQVIVASSDKAYGSQETMPYTEDLPLQGVHPYDVSKSCADLIANSYFVTYGVPVCVTRCGNLFGGGDLNFNRIIPGTIRSVLFGEPPIIRSNSKFIRDYFYIEDAVVAMLLLAQAMIDKKIVGQAFNFGNENKVSAVAIAKLILLRMQSDLPLKILNKANHEIPIQYLSAKKARDLLHWYPIYTITEGIDKTIAWYRDFYESELEHLPLNKNIRQKMVNESSSRGKKLTVPKKALDNAAKKNFWQLFR